MELLDEIKELEDRIEQLLTTEEEKLAYTE